MLQLSEVMRVAAEAGKAVNEVGAFTVKARSEFPDLFRKPGNVEGLKNIESINPSRTEYPSNFEKQPAAKLETYSSEIRNSISSLREAEIYSKAGLKEEVVNGRKALIRTDIDMTRKDEFGLTNLERMRNGNPPIASNGEIVELHHIGQKPDSPFAELTRTEHRGKGNDTILHDKNKVSEIDRSAFQNERPTHWKNRTGAEV